MELAQPQIQFIQVQMIGTEMISVIVVDALFLLTILKDIIFITLKG